MSLFGKLKNRLFKSSKKLEEGLDAIVSDGGTVEREAQGHAPDAEPEPAPQPDPEPQPDPAPETPPAPPPETPAPDLPPEIPEPPQDQPGEAPQEAPQPDPAPQPDYPEIPAPDPVAPQPTPTEAPMPAPETPPASPPQEVPPPSDRPGEAVQERVQAAIPATLPDAGAAPARPGILGRLLGRGGGVQPREVMRRALDDEMLEQLEELLIASDMGVDTALRVTANMAEGRFGKRLSTQEIKEILSQEIARVLEPVARPMPLYPRKPQVVLVVGVNGSGKTTTIGKLASQFKAAGKQVVIAAGDTFRAAAVEQLQIWGERAGVPVLTAPEGSDPASLAFDAMTKAEAEGADLLLIDTAGRLQNRKDLMEELAKIVRVIRKKDPEAPHNTLLVLDATTGQNALSQVQTFRELADVSGLVMTKLDGTAKGGVLVALADKFGLPIHAIGVGEQIDDLAPFDPEEFAAALTGLER
ncbi:signal recognition particle-docking protein FtsY [Lutimaribacter sp. EGI FJ00015]|uniref:Signal recognition particle-docking protein FtsY n=1 Tax=Lutimaribacter degradans TaxID=2945989 RepID=A0ACC5ZRF5_9RHOB|nr:signal recognition particle-docking protein FtsY [Lutimaribacter sp. EGI FJ00013]MCM2560730.1 signal recognition particle-docking protein FtsY [Lutimaribacter sp. EGI FJ00013]MCO0612324.1 signal recognition particle-docking protein FtsY [Lutimaribacter sp. EGI FJ00015]MCO0634555.1 signal recognition particle-docking protein FtsY [Lutimaribacter sp. EGI FJ00014]